MNEFLYASYRRNLRRNANKPPGKARQLHHLERALLIWPLHLWIWSQRRKTKTPTGVFFNAQKEPDERIE